MDEILYFCCHLEDDGAESQTHDNQLFELILDPSPDGTTQMCTRHVGEHLNMDRATVVYPLIGN